GPHRRAELDPPGRADGGRPVSLAVRCALSGRALLPDAPEGWYGAARLGNVFGTRAVTAQSARSPTVGHGVPAARVRPDRTWLRAVGRAEQGAQATGSIGESLGSALEGRRGPLESALAAA